MTGPHIGFLLYPGVTQLDATGPAQVLSLVPGAEIHMVWKTTDLVPTDAGFSIMPTDTFESCPQLNVICVPGGVGQFRIMTDVAVMGFLSSQGEHADYVTSVCAGSLLLGAAGLLEGYRSACHWAFRDVLTNFGATPVKDRVVRDRNRLSGGGVTAGIDFALTLVAELTSEEKAKEIQLMIEYNPDPPFDSGSPETADPKLVSRVRAAFEQSQAGEATSALPNRK